MLNIFLILSGIILAIIVCIIILFVKVNQHDDCKVCKDGNDDDKDVNDINPKDLNDIKDSLNELNSNLIKVSNDFNSYKNDNDSAIQSIKNYINNTVFSDIDNFVKNTKQGVLDIGNFRLISNPDELVLTNSRNSSTGNALRFRIPVAQDEFPPGNNRIDIIASSGLNNQYDANRWIINSVTENINRDAFKLPSTYAPNNNFKIVPIPCNTNTQSCVYLNTKN